MKNNNNLLQNENVLEIKYKFKSNCNKMTANLSYKD